MPIINNDHLDDISWYYTIESIILVVNENIVSMPTALYEVSRYVLIAIIGSLHFNSFLSWYLIFNFILIFCHPGEMKFTCGCKPCASALPHLESCQTASGVLQVFGVSRWCSSCGDKTEESKNQDLVHPYSYIAHLHTLPCSIVFILFLWFHSHFYVPLYFRIANILIPCFSIVSTRN